MARKNYKKARTKVNGRTFQIEFWNDSQFDLPWVRISEVIVKEAKIHWFPHKTEMREVERYINSGWMKQNRLDWAMSQIAKFLQRERDKFEELRQIEEFCRAK